LDYSDEETMINIEEADNTQIADETKPPLATHRQKTASMLLGRSRTKLTDPSVVVCDTEQTDEGELDMWISPKQKLAKEEAEKNNRIQSLLTKADSNKVRMCRHKISPIFYFN
jgi:hypothetical protein